MKKGLFVFCVFIGYVWSLGAQEQTFDSYKEMVANAKAEIVQISGADFHKLYTNALIEGDAEFTLIDIRTEAEYSEAFIPGAFLVQRGVLESRLEKDAVWEAFNHKRPQKNDTIVLYCRSGSRSALAAKSLNQLGYTKVLSLEGGWKEWNELYPNLKKIQ